MNRDHPWRSCECRRQKDAGDDRQRQRRSFRLSLAIIVLLLVMAFHSLRGSLLIMLRAFRAPTAVIIGSIALFAVAIQTGIIMIIFIR